MKKILIILTIILAGCTMEIDNYTSLSAHYLSQSEYNTLLDNLEPLAYVDRAVIDSYLDSMGIDSYESSYYTSGDYKCYSMNWSYWSSATYDWVYYIDVDIWTVNGILRRSMCNYYSD